MRTIGFQVSAAIASKDAGRADDEALSRITGVILDPGFRYPILPESAAEIVDLASHEEVAYRRVDEVIRSEPIIASRILAMANSARFRPEVPILSLRKAMMLLGWSNLREVLWQVLADSQVFRTGDRPKMRQLRAHCTWVAHCTRMLAMRLGLDSEFAYAAGLLHDLGRPLTRQALVDCPELEVDASRESIIDALHPQVGERVAQAWNLPAIVVQTAGTHHRLERPGTDGLVWVVVAAERFGDHHGVAGRQGAIDPEDPLFARLNLSPSEVLELLAASAQLGGMG